MSLELPGANLKGATLAVVAALALALGVYAFALEEEPYHIDELRQTRSYDQAVSKVIEAAFAQDQPPLDPVLNSLVQKVIGVDDWKQRLLPAFSGIAAMGILALLLRRSGLVQGAVVAVLVMAGSALLTSVFVYARPYALPSLLMITYLYISDIWLRDGKKWAAVALGPLALALPLSRTLEPLILLAITAVLLLVFRALKHPRFQGSIWVPITAAAVGVALAGIPVISRLRAQLGGYTNGGPAPESERWLRLLTDVPEVFARSFPFWTVLLVIAALVLASKPARHWLRTQWWPWAIFALPAAFLLGFILSVEPGQPLYDRYFFTWVPAVAVLTALAWEHRSSVLPPLPVVAVGLLLIWMALNQFQALTTKNRGDWEALSETIQSAAPPDAVVVVEHAAPLGAYRPFFYGQPRYLPPEWSTHSSLDLIRNPSRAERPGSLVLALSGPDVSVEGWRAMEVDSFFTVYISVQEVPGPVGIADGLAKFSAALGNETGATLGVAAASVYSVVGHTEEACEIIGALRSSEALAARLQSVLESQESPLLRLECPASVSPRPSDTP